MQYIDLRYINVQYLTRLLSEDNFNWHEFVNEIETQISADICNAYAYINKYDNPSDRNEVDFDSLKNEIETIKRNLEMLRNKGNVK